METEITKLAMEIIEPLYITETSMLNRMNPAIARSDFVNGSVMQ